MEKIHNKNKESIPDDFWIEVDEQYTKDGRTLIRATKTVREDWKASTFNICSILELYKNGEKYFYNTDEGFQSIKANANDLSMILQRYLSYWVPQDRKYWKMVAWNIESYIEPLKENSRYISFLNETIDVKESFKQKKLVALGKGVTTDNKFMFKYIKDESLLNQKSLKLFNDIMSGYTNGLDAKESKEWIDKLLVITGYLLFPTNPDEKIFLLKSVPGTGKSLWREILERIYGTQQSGAYNPMAKDEFAEEGIYKKRLVYNDDLDEGKWPRQVQLQQIASGNSFPVRLHGKGYVDWVKPKAHILFLTNNNVSAPKNSGIWRRLDIFEFNKPIGKNKIPYLNMLTNKSEFIEVVIHFAVKGIEKIFKDRTILKRDESLIDKQLSTQDNIGSFIEDTVNDNMFDGKFIIKPKTIYALYREWFKSENDKSTKELSKRDFLDEFDKKLPEEARSKSRKVNGTVVGAYDLSKCKIWNPNYKPKTIDDELDEL